MSTLRPADELPPHVRSIVDEIESEIGESAFGSVGDIEGRGDGATDDGRVEAAVREILEEIGEDPDRQGLQGTPSRVHRM